jgi:hypothetical protein
MTRISHALVALAGALAAAAKAEAQAGNTIYPRTIPIEVRWSGARPSEVTINKPGGFLVLDHDDHRHRFHTNLTVARPNERHTITVSYGHYVYPFDIEVQDRFRDVNFEIRHEIQDSCTSIRVKQAHVRPASLPEAVNRAVDAGELVSISGPNQCREKLTIGAIEARYLQNQWLSEKSDGLFQPNTEFHSLYDRAMKFVRSRLARKAAVRSNDAVRGEGAKKGILSSLWDKIR